MLPALLLIIFILWGLRLFKIYIVIFGTLLGTVLGKILGYYTIKIIGLPLENLNILTTIIPIATGIAGACLALPLKKILSCISAGVYSGIFGTILSIWLTLPNTIIIFFTIFFIIGFCIPLRYYNYSMIVLMVITGSVITILLLHIDRIPLLTTIHSLFRLENSIMENPIKTLQYILEIYRKYIVYTIILLISSSIYSILFQKNYAYITDDTIHTTYKKALFRNIGYLFAIVLLIGFVYEFIFSIISLYNSPSHVFTFSTIPSSVYKIATTTFHNKPHTIIGTIAPHIVGIGVIHFPFIAMLLYIILSLCKSKSSHIPVVYSNILLGLLLAILFSIILMPLSYFSIQAIIAVFSAFVVPHTTTLLDTLNNYFSNTINKSIQFYTFFAHTPYNESLLSAFIIINKWFFSGIIFPVLFYFFVFKRGKALAYASKLNMTNTQTANTTHSTAPSHQSPFFQKTMHTNTQQQNKQNMLATNTTSKTQKHSSQKTSSTSKRNNSIHYITLLIQKRYRQTKHLAQFITNIFYKIKQVYEVLPNKYGIKGAHLFVRFKEGLPIPQLQKKGILAVQIVAYNATKQDIKNIPLIKEALQRSKASMGMIIITANYSHNDMKIIKQKLQILRKKLQKPIIVIAGKNVARFVLTFGNDIFLNN